jgi:hypothetical protein
MFLTPKSKMKMKKIIVCALLLSALLSSTYAQSEPRTIEVLGATNRVFQADLILYNVTVVQGTSCEIPPSGKNYEKLVKECEKENEKLMASRENILAAIVASFGIRLKVDEFIAAQKYSGSISTLIFTNIADLRAFESKINDVTGAYTGYVIQASYSKADDTLYETLKVEALLSARKKAEKFAIALGATIDKVLNIYEDKPFSSNLFSSFWAKTQGNFATDSAGKLTVSAMTKNGEVTYSTDAYAVFSIK